MSKEKRIFDIALQAGFMVIKGLIEIPSRDALFEVVLQIVNDYDPEVNKDLDGFVWSELIKHFGTKEALEYGFTASDSKNAGWRK